MVTHKLSRRDARRIAVHAQWLHRQRPTELVELVRQITLLQIDPTTAVAPSAHLVAWSRLGSAYDPADLDGALLKRELVELRATIRPAEDIVLFRAEMAAWPGEGPLRSWQEFRRDWVKANDACRRDILRRLSASGPLPSRELPDTCAVSWRSTGWTNNRNVTQLLEFMVSRGEVAVAGRLGNERLWDLAERVYPDTPVVPLKEAAYRRDERRLSALGIPALAVPSTPSSRSMSTRLGKRLLWRAYAEPGESIPRGWVSPSPAGRPYCRPLTACFMIASARPTCSSSTMRSRCTNLPQVVAGDTSRCPFCTATGW